MNDKHKYILDSIKFWIWSGFYEPDDVHEMIDEIIDDGELDDEADEAFLRSTIAPEFEKKTLAEKSWPDQTDCDRLDLAFEALNAEGIIALHNAGYTQQDGFSDVGEALYQAGEERFKGYCFYHEQDVERAVDGGGLTIAFGDLDGDKAKCTEIGYAVKQVLEKHGFTIEWDGDSKTRLMISNMDWKRRLMYDD